MMIAFIRRLFLTTLRCRHMIKKKSLFCTPVPSPPLLRPQRSCHQDLRELFKYGVIQNYLDNLSKEYKHVSQKLNDHLLSEHHRRALQNQYAKLSPIAVLLQDIQNAEIEAVELETMSKNFDSGAEKQLLNLFVEEKEEISRKIEVFQRKLLQILIPKEKHDEKDVILEVTSGRTTGGDICQQFTKEIFEMYQNYADYKCWNFTILNYTSAEYGGLHHASARISGNSVYRHLKYEGGTHRVQRIPEIGLSSRMQRIHTGTMTVIVLPELEEVDIQLDPKDLRVDTFRAKGAGGQHVNTTDSAVRIVHLPTGMSVECQQERSQLQNKETALRILRAKLYQQTLERGLEQRQTARKIQVGTRAQSDRIRTYNYVQDRVTDHRISHISRDVKEMLCGGSVLDHLITKLLESADREVFLEIAAGSYEESKGS
ncbi:peptide chain release factor 1, mitochondrial isoform X1 [Protopterus annectens]|uniref:peptide chain release factor 1, mitochondrial isoform X1 n=1 Tax=Protopterus annectens TaxID=7888 RepID=UPI001CF93E75|nr:peptide chain release factor 1, mitochondrial isoform X1 [Protopterus annectens]